MKKPKFIEITAAIVCLTGIYIISNANLTGLSDGDLIVVSSAFCIALGIVVTEKVSIVSRDFKILIFYQLLFTCIAPTIILRSDLLIIPCDGFFWSVVFYCAILGTIMPLFLQLKYQIR